MPSPVCFPLHRLLAVLVLLLTVGLVAPATGQAGEDYPDNGYTRTVDMTFPLPQGSGYSYVDTYFAPRSGGRLHRATDVMADKMVPIHAVVDGEICFITGIDEPMPHYGYMIRLCGDDGLRYSYVHINNDTPGTDDGEGGVEHAYAPGIERGVRVERGQHIAWVGDSGNAEHTDPHLHFEIFDDALDEQEGRINPYPSLKAAEARGDYPGGTVQQPPNSGGESPSTSDGGSGSDGDSGTDGDTGSDSGTGIESGTVTDGPSSYTRLAGSTRLTTAVALSQETRTRARAVVIVPADSHAEALVAAPLAALIDAPILLSGPDGLDDAVSAEVERLRALSAYVIGTPSQLSEEVEQDLTAAGVQFQARIASDDRYRLSALVAEEMQTYPDVNGIDQVILALGDAQEISRAWPDALSASALAARTITPILLTESGALPDPVADWLTSVRPDEILVIGGVAAVGDDVVEEAAAVAGAAWTRLAGPDRYSTSAAVADHSRTAGLGSDMIWIATGRNFPDALAAGPAAALTGSPLVLVDGANPDGSPASAEWLAGNATALIVVGGEAAVSETAARALLR